MGRDYALGEILNIVDKIREGYLISRPTAIDITYALLDEELLSRRFDNAKEMLRDLLSSDLPVVILMCAWTISFPWRNELGEVFLELNNKIPDEKLPFKERRL